MNTGYPEDPAPSLAVVSAKESTMRHSRHRQTTILKIADVIAKLIAGEPLPAVGSAQFQELTGLLRRLQGHPEERDFGTLGKQCLGALLEACQSSVNASTRRSP
jgi:hypothetical protein